jgi:DNA ligase-associated metallophosphoesterase
LISFENLQARLLANQVIPINYAGNKLLLDASGALVWPQHNMIIFSDLHLEKGSFLSQFAHPLPRFDSADTISRMATTMANYECEHVVCLGDSLHDANAASRMQSQDLDSLNELVNSCTKFTWVLGNHDPDIPLSIAGERAEYIMLNDVLLAHEPDYARLENNQAQIIGHYHPKTSHSAARRKMRGKCFLSSESMLIMPAFGKYTGGLSDTSEAFTPLFKGKSVNAYLIYEQKIFQL